MRAEQLFDAYCPDGDFDGLSLAQRSRWLAAAEAISAAYRSRAERDVSKIVLLLMLAMEDISVESAARVRGLTEIGTVDEFFKLLDLVERPQ